MDDIVFCKCALSKSVDPTRPDYLGLKADDQYVCIPCKPKGRIMETDNEKPWEYEERDGRLFLTPSLLVKGSGSDFHTSKLWNVAYEVCPDGVDCYNHFKAINP